MKPKRRGEPVRRDPKNRRAEQRVKRGGELLLIFDDPGPQEVQAHLLDYSKSGFRAMHRYSALSTGQVVRFERRVSKGRAQVVWNRITGEQVESGFVVL